MKLDPVALEKAKAARQKALVECFLSICENDHDEIFLLTYLQHAGGKCATCNGSGEVLIGDHHDIIMDRTKCHDCGGTGQHAGGDELAKVKADLNFSQYQVRNFSALLDSTRAECARLRGLLTEARDFIFRAVFGFNPLVARINDALTPPQAAKEETTPRENGI